MARNGDRRDPKGELHQCKTVTCSWLNPKWGRCSWPPSGAWGHSLPPPPKYSVSVSPYACDAPDIGPRGLAVGLTLFLVYGRESKTTRLQNRESKTRVDGKPVVFHAMEANAQNCELGTDFRTWWLTPQHARNCLTRTGTGSPCLSGGADHSKLYRVCDQESPVLSPA